MATTMDASVACTAAVRALDRRLRAQEARLAPAVIALRRAVEGARGVRVLDRWTWLAGRVLDHGWGERPGVADRLCALAARAVQRARSTETLLAAGAAHSASLRWWQVQRDLPALVVKGGRRPRCEFCHEPFTASHPNQRYCGRSHARKAEYRRKAGRGVWRRQN